MITRTRRQFLQIAAAATGAAWLGMAPPNSSASTSQNLFRPKTTPPNIIMVTVDALRADHVSAYGYPRNTTPNLDALIAAQGVGYLRATTTSPWTYAANTAMLTGFEPTELASSWDVAGLPANIPTLAEHLQSAGFRTAGFVSAVLTRKSFGFDRGFDHYDDSLTYGHPNSVQGVAKELNDLSLAWLDANQDGDRPLFLYLYYFDPHSWYNPPPPYDMLFDNTYTGALTPAIIQDGQPFVDGTITPTARDIEYVQAIYDGEIAYWDAMFGEMMAALQNRSLLNNALITVTADHGESFGEQDKWAHASSLYEEAMRVPLLLRYPGAIKPGTTISTPVSNMDLMPTILEYAGFQGPLNVSAQSLRPLHEGTSFPKRDVYCELDGMNDPNHWIYWNASRVDLRAVYRGDWKYIHHVGHAEDDELYWLGDSPANETDNLLADEPILTQKLRTSIMNHYALWRNNLPSIAR